MGEEGWCVGLELRPGDQHSQKDFAFFLDRVLPRAKALAGERRLLMTLDAGHDVAANREPLQNAQTDYLIKWNPRSEDPQAWAERASNAGLFQSVGKISGLPTLMKPSNGHSKKKTYTARRVACLIERTTDRQGQPVLFPVLE